MNYSVTKHARERWQERVNPTVNNILDIEQQVLEALGNAEYVGADISDNKSFYINSDHWFFVVDTVRNTIVTVFETDYGFTPALNKKIADDLMKEIKKKRNEFDKVSSKCEDELATIKNAKELLQNEIALKEAEIRKLEAKEINVKADVDIVESELKTLIKQLTNSFAYKKELLVLKNEK